MGVLETVTFRRCGVLQNKSDIWIPIVQFMYVRMAMKS